MTARPLNWEMRAKHGNAADQQDFWSDRAFGATWKKVPSVFMLEAAGGIPKSK